MTRMKTIVCVALGLVALRLTGVDAACKACSLATYAACLNETGFAICFDGKTVSSTHGVCPEGQVCAEKQGICHPRDTIKPTCGKCGSCYQIFSCKSRTQFEFCNNNAVTGVVVSCPKGEYCNVNNFIKTKNICMKSCLGEPTCYADEFVEAPPPEPTYKDACTGKTVRGTYDNIYDPTCKTYVYCEELNQEMNAVLYTCSSGYFNAALTECLPNKPARCA